MVKINDVIKTSATLNSKLYNLQDKDIYNLYDYKIIDYGNGYKKSVKYDQMIMTRKSGIERAGIDSAIKKRIATRSKNKKSEELQVIRPDSLTRTKNKILDLVLANNDEWISFITLTFKKNLGDVTVANKKFANWVRQVKRAFPGFKYLGVPEFQKRGAIHYHILTNIPVGSALIPKREQLKTKTKKGFRFIDYYDLPYWSYGFSSAFDITSTDSNFNVGLYMCKYLYKDIDNRLWGRRKILKSSNLLTPTVRKMNSNYCIDYAFEEMDFQNSYNAISSYHMLKTTERPNIIPYTSILYKKTN